ncbi:hypothetical protein KKF64_01595 [Patescibacteria group bacterium]|nr:hypothetical protein [Patescibacteria group bacterium]
MKHRFRVIYSYPTNDHDSFGSREPWGGPSEFWRDVEAEDESEAWRMVRSQGQELVNVILILSMNPVDKPAS